MRGRNGSRNERVNKHNKDSCKPVKPPFSSPKKFDKANLHELLAELFSENSLPNTNEADNAEKEKDADSALLVNSTHANSISPGNIRN